MANKEKIDNLLHQIQTLHTLVSGVYEAEIYPASFFDRAIGITHTLLKELHGLEAEQLEELRRQMEAHQALIQTISAPAASAATAEATEVKAAETKAEAVQSETVFGNSPQSDTIQKADLPQNTAVQPQQAAPAQAETAPTASTPEKTQPEESRPMTATPDAAPQQPAPQPAPAENPISEAATAKNTAPDATAFEPETEPLSAMEFDEPDLLIPDPMLLAREIPEMKTAGTESAAAEKGKPTIGSEHSGKILSDVLEKKNLSDFRKAFSLNDRFRFRRELFQGDEAKMNQVIDELNQIHSYPDSVAYLQTHVTWNPEDPAAIDFMKLLEKRFM